ncbi:hypothetical protein [Chitinophaga sedimenti]|nr:hypothetical protein [Chitinophaga sedimenti]
MTNKKNKLKGYPHYPASEDIYNKAEKTGEGGGPDNEDVEDLPRC